MRDIWYADDRDLAKWGVLVHLARAHSLKTIVQVPYWRPEKNRPHFTFRKHRESVPEEVWGFFRDVKRIERLGDQCGLKVKVLVERFKHADREPYSAYIGQQLRRCARPLLLFLDPDTGLEPKNPNVTHTTKKEVHSAWSELHPGEWLVFYQHARHKRGWVTSVSAQLAKVCGGATVEVARSEEIGKDIAFLCLEKRAG